MSDELEFPEPEETRALLRDVTAFLDAYNSDSTCTGRRRSKKRWAKDHPGYDRHRREKKKAEREALRNQISQYEAKLELLRAQKHKEVFVSKWGWVDAATMEEEERLKAEELNRKLKSLLVYQLRTVDPKFHLDGSEFCSARTGNNER